MEHKVLSYQAMLEIVLPDEKSFILVNVRLQEEPKPSRDISLIKGEQLYQNSFSLASSQIMF